MQVEGRRDVRRELYNVTGAQRAHSVKDNVVGNIFFIKKRGDALMRSGRSNINNN